MSNLPPGYSGFTEPVTNNQLGTANTHHSMSPVKDFNPGTPLTWEERDRNSEYAYEHAQEEEHCDTCGGKGYPTLQDLLALSRAEVLGEVRGKLKGLDCGFCNYESEVKLRLDELEQAI